MKVVFLFIIAISCMTFFSKAQAFEETLPDHAHRICLGNGESPSGDAEIYLGCVGPGMGIQEDNWTNVKIPALGHSSQMVSTVTDGKNWYMANTSESKKYVYIGNYNNQSDSNTPNTSNWSNSDLGEQLGKSHGGVGLASDQDRWCIVNTTGDSPYRIYLGCTTNLENVSKATDWKNVDLSETLGKSRGAVDLATDGINWAITGTENSSDDIHVGVMVNPLNYVLNPKNWKDVDLSGQLGAASTPMDIATDGKRWCIANTTGGGGHEIYIGCTKEQGLDPSVPENWKNEPLKARLGKSHSGLSLATDGIVWCMGNTGGGDREIYLGCTAPGTDPLDVNSWSNYNLKKKMGKSQQGADVAFYRSCYYPGEKPSNNNAPNHGCCAGVDYNPDTERCELSDFSPNTSDLVTTQGTGCQTNFDDNTQTTFTELAQKLRLFHLMFASDKPEGMATFSVDQKEKYLADLIEFFEKPKKYQDIQYGPNKGGAPIEMGDALIEVATLQKETLKAAYKKYDDRLKTIAKTQDILLTFIKKPIDKITPEESKAFAKEICTTLFPDSSYKTQGKEGALETCLSSYAQAPQTMALILQEQSLNNQADFYQTMADLFTQTQVLLENVTRLAKNETWNCSYSTTMQCGSKRVFDVDTKIFYINPLFPAQQKAAYDILRITSPTTMFSGDPKNYRGTKPIGGDKIPKLQAWYESKEFTELEGKEYGDLFAMLTENLDNSNSVGLPAISDKNQQFLDAVTANKKEVKGAFDLFLMLTQYRIMTQEELANEKLPVLSLIPPQFPNQPPQKIFFRKNLMAYVIDLEMMNNYLANYFQTGSSLAANQSACVDTVITQLPGVGGDGGTNLGGAQDGHIGGNNPNNSLGAVNARETVPEQGGSGSEISNNNIQDVQFGHAGDGAQVTLGGHDSSSSSGGSNHNSSSHSGGAMAGGGNSQGLNAVRAHMKKREAKFLKLTSSAAGQNFAKNVKDGLASYNQTLAQAMKAGLAHNAAKEAAKNSTSSGALTPPETNLSNVQENLKPNAEDSIQGASDENPTSSGHNSWDNSGSSASKSDGDSTNPTNSNPSGLSDAEKNRLLSGLKDSNYSANEDDSLFQIITKRYWMSGIPRLLSNKKKHR